MPREIHKTWTVYKFNELDAPAQEKAVEQIREKLSGPWWDSSDNDDIRNTIVWKFAHEIGTPGCEKYGEVDYPGIPSVTLEGFDLDRGQSVVFKGTLTRENAPGIRWPGSVESVDLEAKRDHTYITAVSKWDDEDGDIATQMDIDTVEQAVRDAMHTAWKAGYDEMEYKTGEEYAKDFIESNEYEFEEDGDLFDS